MGGERRRKIHFSNILTFTCGRASFKEDHSQIGGPGFSRVAFANDSECFEAWNLNYPSNYVSTTKYTLATFLPKSLFEQFRRAANIYFLVVACLSFTSLSPYSPFSSVLPLVIVIGATMAKEAVEDWRRNQQDVEINNRKVLVHRGDGTFEYTEWKNLKVGDIVKVEKDDFFPADLVLLSSSYDDAVCYVETTNLDGETNLKLKQALEVTSGSQNDSSFRNFKAIIKCEDPNANLYTFIGSLDYDEQQYALSPQQLLLRDSKLRNADYIYGAVTFTGPDTKVRQNATDPPSKRSRVERKMDKIIYFLFFLLVLMAGIGSIFFGITTNDDLNDGKMKRWYLRPDHTKVFYDPKRAALAAILHFLTAMMLFGYLIPISLYVSIEIVKVLQSMFINQDIYMYYEDTDKPAHARTSNLNEELGQVDTILSDKTGTLTCNSMEFIKCSIAGTAYGRGVTEVEKAMARRKGSPLPQEDEEDHEDDGGETKPAVKGFNFKDERVMNGNWIDEPHADVIQKFFRLLAICHTAIPEVDEESGKISYEAESPDEAAFVIAARELGFQFYQRTQTNISLHELDLKSGTKVERQGADSVMFERLAKYGRKFEDKTKEHMNEYADAGLRTLVLAYRQLDAEEYAEFSEEFNKAKNSISADRDERIDGLVDGIERDLILLGATAVEDKLQNGVPECIDKLAQAGIKIWVLTGDKMETAVNIGFACSLLRQGMKQIIITLESPEIVGLEKEENKKALIKDNISGQRRVLFKKESLLSSSRFFALKEISHIWEDDVKNTEADIGIGISGVEGMQAVMSSDVAIAQFRFLERLLLVHGHWCYRRITSMMALSVSYFTLIQHIFIWGGIALWYLFLLVYGAMTPDISTNAYMVFIEGCAPAASYWVVTLFVVIGTLIPYFSYAAIQMRFFPMYHGMIQWIRSEGRCEDPEYCAMVRQRSIRPTTVGYTARREAKAPFGTDTTRENKCELEKRCFEIFQA
ncbi:putative phospholipid-transporting ATPase 9 [Acorus calamus]|uniref:Phospholipid-transporting ATPase n=1 Tax=Acorus calamus TaxID=4465 RepID=A0AAV9DGF6_ACOCL|nr:putative phospholipid-transporting ATPase 9 [Acorus calamus]